MPAIDANVRDTLLCLFLHGPTYDGEVPSKSARDELYKLKMIQRSNGFQWLTDAGVQWCFDLGFESEKRHWQHEYRKKLWELAELRILAR